MNGIDLKELGRMLRHRRELLDLTREEIARRVDVTPAYIFLIETARPRKSGTPSRPKRETLKRWTQAMGMSDDQTSTALQLAGYHPLDLDLEFRLESLHEDPDNIAGTSVGFSAPAGGPDDWNDARRMYRRIDTILDRARERGSWEFALQELAQALDDVEKRLHFKGENEQ